MKGSVIIVSWKYEKDGYTVVKTCAWSPPGDHPVGCGLRLYVKDGKLVKVEGDPAHPITNGRLCPRCLALTEYIYHPQRIIYPMKRDKADRGKDKWTRITWDEAYDMIEKNVTEIKAKYGPESIFSVIGTGRDMWHTVPFVTFGALGSPNFSYIHSGWSCYGPRCSITVYTMGAGYPEIDYAAQFQEDRFDNPEYKLPECLIVWGKEPLKSNADGLFGHAIVDMMKRGTKLIVVDPRLTWLANRAEYWLQLRPGTDAALALGMLNVIINEDLYDHEFATKWCHGFEDLKKRVQEYPPEKVAEITWVPKEKIIAAARFYANAKPASISWGLATDQKPNGVQHAHALCALMAICGNIDVPGGVLLGAPSFAAPMWWGWDSLPPELQEKRLGAKEYPAVSTAISTVQPDLPLDAMETGKPYPLKMSWVMSSNPIACPTAAPQRWDKAFKNLDFNVVCDLFMTPSAASFGDLFLPVAAFPEKDGIVATHYGSITMFLGAINKAIQVGECKSDDEILLELGKRLNPSVFPWNNIEEFLDWELDQYIPGMKFAELREKGWALPPWQYKKYEKGTQTFDQKPGFITPTGKLELSSTLFEQWGEDPLPYYEEPPYSPYSTPELAKEYPFILTTGARSWVYFHSEQRMVKSLREIHPDPITEIHPDAAERLGIKNGDWVYIENMFGKAKQKAKLTLGIDPRVVHSEHAWWFPEKKAEGPNPSGVYDANINNLVPHKHIGKLGFGAPYKCMICKVYKAEA
ncbi:dehydrogenase [Candidatus Formimonas warabiya]|uniref:Dehydrogenase n=1 Tax=Formimonas warabiya TaxID=1761012 RepID=A0A3G1L0W8_FORW1|nr:dehydrogenase [Candidatus Formimonas warabiya]